MHCTWLVFLASLSFYFPVFHDVVVVVCNCGVMHKCWITFHPSGKTLYTVINNCPWHVWNNLINVWSQSSHFHCALHQAHNANLACMFYSTLYGAVMRVVTAVTAENEKHLLCMGTG